MRNKEYFTQLHLSESDESGQEPESVTPVAESQEINKSRRSFLRQSMETSAAALLAVAAKPLFKSGEARAATPEQREAPRYEPRYDIFVEGRNVEVAIHVDGIDDNAVRTTLYKDLKAKLEQEFNAQNVRPAKGNQELQVNVRFEVSRPQEVQQRYEADTPTREAIGEVIGAAAGNAQNIPGVGEIIRGARREAAGYGQNRVAYETDVTTPEGTTETWYIQGLKHNEQGGEYYFERIKVGQVVRGGKSKKSDMQLRDMPPLHIRSDKFEEEIQRLAFEGYFDRAGMAGVAADVRATRQGLDKPAGRQRPEPNRRQRPDENFGSQSDTGRVRPRDSEAPRRDVDQGPRTGPEPATPMGSTRKRRP